MNKKIGFIGQGWIGSYYVENIDDKLADEIYSSLEKKNIDLL